MDEVRLFVTYSNTCNVLFSYHNTLIMCQQILQEVSGFIDIDKIDPDACPALVVDLSAGEQGIVALAFGLLSSPVTASLDFAFPVNAFKLDFSCRSL